MFERETHHLFERLISTMADNTQALADLQAAVVANTAAVDAAVVALGTPAPGAEDISAGVEAATQQVTANTNALTGATPATPAPAEVESPAEDAGENEPTETPVTTQVPPPVAPPAS